MTTDADLIARVEAAIRRRAELRGDDADAVEALVASVRALPPGRLRGFVAHYEADATRWARACSPIDSPPANTPS